MRRKRPFRRGQMVRFVARFDRGRIGRVIYSFRTYTLVKIKSKGRFAFFEALVPTYELVAWSNGKLPPPISQEEFFTCEEILSGLVAELY